MYIRENNSDDGEIVAAAYRRDVEEVRRLLDRGESVNARDTNDDLTLLHIACMTGNEKLVDVILDRDQKFGDVDFEAKTKRLLCTAWQLAAREQHFELAHRVHEAGLAKKNSYRPLPSP